MRKLCASILVFTMLFGVNICTYAQDTGLPEGAIVLKDIFKDSFTGCTWGGWSITGEITDDNVKEGEKSFKILGKADGSFGQGAITFSSSISGNDKIINAAIAEGCAYVGAWEYIQSGTSWFEVKLNNGSVIKASTRGAWEYVYSPLTAAGNSGQFLYLKNQSTKDYWIDQIQVFMLPPENTSMNISSVVFFDRANAETDRYNVYIESPIEINFDHYVMPDTANVELFDSNSNKLGCTVEFNDRKIKVTPLQSFDYSAEYKIKISGAKNVFDETVDDEEVVFYTVQPEFRVEYVNYQSGGNFLTAGDTFTEIQADAMIINDSDENMNYRFVGFMDDENGEKVFYASDSKVCNKYSISNVSISRDNFGTVEYSSDEQFGYYFLDQNNITVDEHNEDSTEFSELTDASLIGKKLEINIKTESEKKRKFTVEVLRQQGGGYDWTVPGFVYCGTLDDNGAFSKEFSISDYMPLGSYDVLIYVDGNAVPWKKSGFYYTGKQKREEIVSTIKAGSKGAISSMLNDGEEFNALKSIGIMIDKYNDLTERKAFVAELISGASTEEKADETLCVKLLNKCILLQLMNEASDKTDFLLENLQLLEVSDRVKSTLSLIKENGNIDSFKLFFNAKVYADFETLYKELDNFALFSGLNTVKEGDYPLVQQYFNTYKDVIDYDISAEMDKNRITAHNQILVLKNLIGLTFRTKTDVVNAAKAQIERYKQSSGSGGSGGGGGSASSVIKNPGVSVSTDVLTHPSPSLATKFTDVGADFWANSYISELASRGIINGYEDNTYRPNNSVTRAEFIKILVAALFSNYEFSGNHFEDVKESHWAYKYISFAYEKGLISGTDERHFAPDKSITNEEMAVICSRTLEYLNFEIPDKKIQAFNDFNDISDYAKMSVTNLRAMEIVVGNEDYCFLPKNNSTRAQTAKIVYQIMDLGGEK